MPFAVASDFDFLTFSPRFHRGAEKFMNKEENNFSGRHPDNSQNLPPKVGAESELEDTRRPSRLNGMRIQEQLPLDFKASSPVAPF